MATTPKKKRVKVLKGKAADAFMEKYIFSLTPIELKKFEQQYNKWLEQYEGH